MSQRRRDAHRDRERDREAEGRRRARGTKEDWPTEEGAGKPQTEGGGPGDSEKSGWKKGALGLLALSGVTLGRYVAVWPWSSSFVCLSLSFLVCRKEVVILALYRKSVAVKHGKSSV